MELFWISAVPAVTIFFCIGFLVGRRGDNDNSGPLVYDFEDSPAGQVAHLRFRGMDKEKLAANFPSTLRDGQALALQPGLKAYLLKDAAVFDAPPGELIHGTIEEKQDEGSGG